MVLFVVFLLSFFGEGGAMIAILCGRVVLNFLFFVFLIPNAGRQKNLEKKSLISTLTSVVFVTAICAQVSHTRFLQAVLLNFLWSLYVCESHTENKQERSRRIDRTAGYQYSDFLSPSDVGCILCFAWGLT